MISIFLTFLLVKNFSDFSFTNTEIFSQNIVLSGILTETENPSFEAEKLFHNWRSEFFSCGNMKIFGLDANISVVVSPEKKYFFGENMATGDFYDCKNNEILKYNFVKFADENSVLEKEIFTEKSYKRLHCEGKWENFEKFFEDEKLVKIVENNEKITECEEIFSEWKNLAKEYWE